MNTLEAQIEAEAAVAAGHASPPDADAAAAADAEVDDLTERRKAKDRERKRAEREKNGSTPRRGPGRPRKAPSEPGASSATPAKSKKKDTDPRVTAAIVCTFEVLTAKEVNPEMAERMHAALVGALHYEIEVRLPEIADEYESEVALGTACVGGVVSRFRLARHLARKSASETVIRDVPPPAPQAAPEPTPAATLEVISS